MEAETSHSRFLIVGFGNPLRGDDRVGWAAIERLGLLGDELRDAELVSFHQLMPELAKRLAGVSGTILIDAAVDIPAGVIRLQEIHPDQRLPEMMHDLSPGQLAGLALGLYGHCGPIILLTVGGACWEMTDRLSPSVAAALDELVRRVMERIGAWRAGHA